MRAKRHERRQRQYLELRWQVRGQQVLGPAKALPRRVGGVDEPVCAVPPKYVGGGLGARATARDLQHQAGEVAAAEPREPIHDLATANRRCNPR